MMTEEQIVARLLAGRLDKPPAPKPPKPAQVRADERWAQKPVEVVIQDEANANEAVIKRLRAEQERRRAHYQSLIDRAWQNQHYQAELLGLGRPSFHKGPGDPDWGLR
jgi:hypothetical protein